MWFQPTFKNYMRMKKILFIFILIPCTIAAIAGSATLSVTPGNDTVPDSSVIARAGRYHTTATPIYKCEMKKTITAPCGAA